MRLSQASVDKREVEFIEKVVFEQTHFGMGQEVKKFEEELQAYVGSEFLPVATNTGTSAIHLALQAMDIGADCEVLAPSITYLASHQAISATGAKAVSCEVLAENALMDLKDAETRITSKTKAILYVHYASHFDNRDEVYALAKKYNLRVLEDAAHSFGCHINNNKIGSEGDTLCFSFDGIKNITCGEGGAIFSSDKKLLQRANDLRLLAVEKDTEKRYIGERSWEFDVVEQGWRYHMSNIMAAIGRCQLQKFESELMPKRLKLAEIYNEALKDVGPVKLLKYNYKTTDKRIVSHIFPVMVEGSKKSKLRDYLKSFQIETGVHYFPNHLLSYYKTSYPLPVAEKYFESVLTLPFHPGVTEEDARLVCEKLKGFFAENE